MKPSRFRLRELVPPASEGKAKAAWALAVWAFGLFAALSCGRIHPPLAHYGPEGERILVKRLPAEPAVDMLTRFDRVAFEPGATFAAKRLSLEQQTVYDTYGHPDYVRKPFESGQGEMVDEWLYLRHNLLVQWIDGHKVFEGEVTDIERTLIERGYPDFAWIDEDELGINRQIWTYSTQVSTDRMVFSFTNGKLVFRKSLN